ncbi:MAG TPA: hypothetical protein VLL75_17935 [Vicinamibacteria bacterium]|nr:hypothetical protein [Vicinamibacteria bacterium]
MPKETAAVSRGGRNGKLVDPRGPRAARRTNPAAGGRVIRVAREEAGLAAPEAAPRGAATLTEGLDPFDRERASSLADEGGMAGATVEAQPPAPERWSSSARKLWLAASCGLAGLAALYLRRSR